jgi:hypothetical protein
MINDDSDEEEEERDHVGQLYQSRSSKAYGS